MKANLTNVLIGIVVILAVVYYLRSPSADSFEDLPKGGLIGLIVFIIFVCLGFVAIFTHKS